MNGTTNVWNQNFGYGALGNITKTVPTGGTGTSFQASYNNLNQITTVGSVAAQYDLNGNLTFDPTTSIHYTWDAENRPASLNGFGLTVDALGRIVEKNGGGGVYYQYVFAPTGEKVAVYKGQNLSRTYLPLPGGAEVNYGSSGISAYAHADWLGSIRLATSQGRNVLADIPYGPYGEPYSTRTGTYSPEFTGRELDITSPLYDFIMRENNYIQGRWISPDPAGMAAVDPADPQTWNRYTYVTNGPLNSVDPLGLVGPFGDCTTGCRRQGGYNYDAFDFFPGAFSTIGGSWVLHTTYTWTDWGPDSFASGSFWELVEGPGSVTFLDSVPSVTAANSDRAANTATISAYHPSVGQCLAQAALDAGLDLTSLSMLPDANQDSWQWQSAGWNSGFVYTGAAADPALGASTGVDALEKGADWVADSPWAQGEIRQFLRSQGVKWSVKQVSKDAAWLGKWAGRIGGALAAYSAYQRYQKCRGY